MSSLITEFSSFSRLNNILFCIHGFLFHSSIGKQAVSILWLLLHQIWESIYLFKIIISFIYIYTQKWNCWIIWKFFSYYHGVKEESEKGGLKFNIQKTKIMASGLIISWQIEWKEVETMTDFIFWTAKWLQTVTVAMKLKDACSLERKLWQT